MKFIILGVLGLFVVWLLYMTGLGEALLLLFVAGAIPGTNRTIPALPMLIGFGILLGMSIWFLIGQYALQYFRTSKQTLQKD